MKIEFSKEDAEKILYDSFCNGGLEELFYSSVVIDWESKLNATNYQNAKNKLLKDGNNSICREDIYVEILKMGNDIIFTDYESEEFVTLNLDKALLNFNLLSDNEKIELAKLLDDNDLSTDAYDCFNALQYALYKEVIFG